MKKNRPLWLRCLLVVLFTVVLTHKAWLPITENTGRRYTHTLEDSYEYRGYIYLDLGEARAFRVVDCDATRSLLSADALGKTCEVTASYHSGRNPRGYYLVHSLSCGGAALITAKQSEAIRLAELPSKLAVFGIFDAAICLYLVLRERKKSPPDKEADECSC